MPDLAKEIPGNEISMRSIAGEAVHLRRFTLDDAGKVFLMSIKSGMKRWIPDQVYENVAHTREVLAFLIEQYETPGGPAEKPLVFGVCLQSTGELIGHVGLSPVTEGVEIGYAIEECQQGHGYAADAVRAVTAWAMQRFQLSAVLGIVPAANRASRRTLENAGFQFRQQNRRLFHGRLTAVMVYELLPWERLFPAGCGRFGEPEFARFPKNSYNIKCGTSGCHLNLHDRWSGQ